MNFLQIYKLMQFILFFRFGYPTNSLDFNLLIPFTSIYVYKKMCSQLLCLKNQKLCIGRMNGGSAFSGEISINWDVEHCIETRGWSLCTRLLMADNVVCLRVDGYAY